MIGAAVATVVSCRGSGNASREYPDMDFIRELGHEYAADYRAMLDGSSELEREDFLLNVNAREAELERVVGADYAREFRRAFADSAFVQ